MTLAVGDWWDPRTWVYGGIVVASQPEVQVAVLQNAPIVGPLYWGGYALNEGLNAVSGTPSGTINTLTKALSAYDSGNVLGDLNLVTHPGDIWQGGSGGGGGFQPPIFNKHTGEAAGEFIDSAAGDFLKKLLLWGGLGLGAVLLAKD